MSAYATHLTILQSFFNDFEIGSVFEFGVGNNSTPLFIDRAKKILSVEMQDAQWFIDIYNKYRGAPQFNVFCMMGSTAACEYLTNQKDNFDLVFVDGHAERYMQVNSALTKTKIVIAHDTSLKAYGWSKTNLPPDWKWVDIINFDPWTSIITCESRVIDWCKKFDHVIYTDMKDKVYKY
jgi:hypothetical protein